MNMWGAQVLPVLSLVWPRHMVSALSLHSESFTAYLMEDNGMIKASFYYKYSPVPTHLSLFNKEIDSYTWD